MSLKIESNGIPLATYRDGRAMLFSEIDPRISKPFGLIDVSPDGTQVIIEDQCVHPVGVINGKYVELTSVQGSKGQVGGIIEPFKDPIRLGNFGSRLTILKEGIEVQITAIKPQGNSKGHT